jgi:Ca-activated chloride channel family protein
VKRRGGVRSTLLALSLAIAGSSQARQEPVEDAGVTIYLYAPKTGAPALGLVDVHADVLADAPLDEVQVRVDGVVKASFEKPPYRARIDVGEDNVEHRFEIVARRDGRDLLSVERVTPPIKVDEVLDLSLQQLYVTALERGRFAERLERDEFVVRDDGALQEIVTFERGDVPITAALLLDSSESMRGAGLRLALEGAKAFLAGLRELDEASVMLVSDHLIIETEPTFDVAELTASLEGVEAGGGTAIHDHLYLVLRRLEGRQGRRVAILLSDGVDVHGALEAADVLWAARRSRSVVYWIRLEDASTDHGFASQWRDSGAHREALERLGDSVTETGGRVVAIRDIAAAPAAFEEILSELRAQYVLGYYPSVDRDDESWHDVAVSVRRSGVDLRTRSGYLDAP